MYLSQRNQVIIIDYLLVPVIQGTSIKHPYFIFRKFLYSFKHKSMYNTGQLKKVEAVIGYV